MKTKLQLIAAAFTLAAPLFAAQEHLPLNTGNSWLYRERVTQTTLSITVGLPALMDGNVYYRLTGYVTAPLWVRFHDDGALYYRDEERSQDVLLTSFEPFEQGWFEASYRICDQMGQVRLKRGTQVDGPSRLPSTLVIAYRALGCADAGVQEEQYAENIGLVQRTENSFTGPRIYDLVSARIGPLTFQADPGAGFSISHFQRPNLRTLSVSLDLQTRGGQPVTLHALSAQEIEVLLRAPDGSLLWRWSDGKVFAAFVRDETTSGRSWTVDVPLTDKAGNSLPAGNYEVEAWILSGYDRPQFAASAPVVLAEEKLRKQFHKQ